MFALISLLWLVPGIAITPLPDSLGLRVTVQTTTEAVEDLMSCTGNGLEMQYRLELTACNQNGRLFGKCSRQRVSTNFLQKDLLNQTFVLESDVHDDGEPQQIRTYRNSADAYKKMITFPIYKPQLKRPVFYYARLYSQCQGSSYDLIERLGYFISLGLFRGYGFDTGWVKFRA